MKTLDYKKRIEKIRKILEEQKIDVFLLTPSVNFGYLFKGFFGISERLICGVITLDENLTLVAPHFEKERMQVSTIFDNIITWNEEENPYTILRNAIDCKTSKIALEPTTTFEVYNKLKKIFPETNFVNGGKYLSEMRSIKSDAELERITNAANYTVEGIMKTIESLEEGATEIDAMKAVQENMSELSGELSWGLVQFDEHSALPHGNATKKRLKQNSVVLIDAGTSSDHYFADITVTTTFGKPSNEFLKIYSIVEESNNKALETSHVGIPAENVDFAAREVIEKAGYGKYFTHRLGHGLGLDVHEEPYIVKGNKELLRRGNVHTDEPGIYLPDKFGIRIEDDIVITEKGERIVEFDRCFWEKS